MLEKIIDMDATSLLLAGFVVGSFITVIMGFVIHMITGGFRKKRQAQREELSKSIAKMVGNLNTMFFTYRLGDTEFGVMERECRDILSNIEEEIEENSQILDAGYVALVSHYIENKKDQLVGIRHDIELKRNEERVVQQAVAAAPAVIPTPTTTIPVTPIAPPVAPTPAPAPVATPTYEETVFPVQNQTPPSTPVMASSTGKEDVSLSFADFASAMQEAPLNVAHDDPASISDSFHIPATATPVTPPQEPAVNPHAQATTIAPQTNPQDVEATQEFSLHDIMQQGVAQQQQAPAPNGGMITGDDVANKFDSLFGQ